MMPMFCSFFKNGTVVFLFSSKCLTQDGFVFSFCVPVPDLSV